MSQIATHKNIPNLWIGIGCQKGSSQKLFATAIEKVFQENQLNENAIEGVATIDKKASELGLREFCNLRRFPLKIFSAAILSTVPVPNPSKTPQKQLGTSSVAEAAAILAASHTFPGLGITQDVANTLTTEAQITQRNQDLRDILLLVPKYIFRLRGEPGTVTVAVACVTEFCGKNS
ncbi:cobalamin biosynthesis protein [Nodularia chucula]|uniref:cobalamin biosynthesis protein n=1 Tax=Nodularia chucula TaxID=3093667 RepID=UPI0039C5EE69